MSPSTLQNAERNLVSPAALGSNLQYGLQSTVSSQPATVVQNEKKHFKRKRVNTKTPSSFKSTTAIISAPGMQWDYARKLSDSFANIVAPDQIKECDMKLFKHEIHVQLTSVEAATNLVEKLNQTTFLDKLVTAYIEQVPSVVVSSPQTRTI